MVGGRQKTGVQRMTKVKICGITNVEDAFAAVKAGADALGFVFYKKSPRYISPSKAKRIIEALPPFVGKVGVFVDERAGAVRDIISFCGIDTVQFHGQEDHHECHRFKRYGVKIIKAFRVKDCLDLEAIRAYRVHAILLDAYSEHSYGGTGTAFNWGLLQDARLHLPVILSGGLNPQNIEEAIRIVKPYAVDVSSGVECEPGKKDHSLVRVFLKNARNAA